MISLIGWIAFYTSISLDVGSYVRQIQKLLRTRSSDDISSTCWYLKWWKDGTAIVACMLLNNYVGALLATVGLVMCSITLYLIVRFKPKEWKEQSIIGKIL